MVFSLVRLCAHAGMFLSVAAVAPDPQAPAKPQAPPAQRQPQAQPRPVTVPGGDFRIQSRPRADLGPRFRDPIPNPPRHLPPVPRDRPDHTWRWHRHHGWVLLPVAVAPVQLVLPQTYALPQTVVTAVPVAAPVQVICPHCKQAILVEVK